MSEATFYFLHNSKRFTNLRGLQAADEDTLLNALIVQLRNSWGTSGPFVVLTILASGSWRVPRLGEETIGAPPHTKVLPSGRTLNAPAAAGWHLS